MNLEHKPLKVFTITTIGALIFSTVFLFVIELIGSI
jgi:hypothetical protein